jgi:hypothetical protein
MTCRYRLERVFFIFFCLMATAAYCQQHTTSARPEDVVKAFYKFHLSHDMGFSEDSVKVKEAWFTKDLLEKMLAKLREPVPQYQDPDIDGDPFTDSQEYPKRFKIKGSSIAGDKATVMVQVYPPGRKRNIQVVLLHQPEGWLIDDLVYEDATTLRKQLLLR